MWISSAVPQMLNWSSLKEVTSCKKFKSSIKWFFFLLISNAASLPCFFCHELLFILAPWLNELSESLGAACYLTQKIYWLADSYIFPIFTNKKENIQKEEGIFKNVIEKLSFCLGTKMNILELWAKEKGSGLGGTLCIWCHLSGGFHFHA